MAYSVTPDTVFSGRMLWSRILAEANQAIACEPDLAPIFEDILVEHTCLADALSIRVANLIAPATRYASILRSAFCDLLDREPSLLDPASFDLVAVLDRDPATTKALDVLQHGKGFTALQAHRFAHALWVLGRKELALYVQGCVSRSLQVDIHPAARLGSGIFLDHATGIVIGETSVIEDDVSILQNVTLGGTGKEAGNRHPKIGKGALIGAGATILGNIVIGPNARIGAGSVVLKPVPAGATVAGVPAKIIRLDRATEPSRTMNQVFDSGRPYYDVGL